MSNTSENEIKQTTNSNTIIYPADFCVNSQGLFHLVRDSDGTIKNQEKIGNKIDIVAFGTALDGKTPSAVLRFQNRIKQSSIFILPLDELHDYNSKWSRRLVKEGYILSTKNKKLFENFIFSTIAIEENEGKDWQIIKKNGWHNHSYVLKDMIFGDKQGIIPDVGINNKFFTCKGSFESWKEAAKLAQGNYFFEFSLATAFAGVLMSLVSIRTGIIFHLYGTSSAGKSIAQTLGTSVWGSPAQFISWKGSQTGFETEMVCFNNNFAAIDEFTQAKASDVQDIIYMVANGVGKARATKNVTLRDTNSWLVLGLSSGEQTVEDKIAETGKNPQAGAMVRMPNIPINNDMFTNLHTFVDSQRLVEAIERQVQNNYGFAGQEYLKYLTENYDEIVPRILEKYNEYEKELLPLNAGTQLKRITKYFSLVMVASDIINECGIINFDCRQGIKKLYDSCVDSLDTNTNIEEKNIIENLKGFIHSNEYSRFQKYGGFLLDNDKIINCAGVWDTTDNVYYFYPELFYKEIVKTSNKKLVKNILSSHNMLLLDNDGKNPKKSFGSRSSKRYIAIRLPDETQDMNDDNNEAENSASAQITNFKTFGKGKRNFSNFKVA